MKVANFSAWQLNSINRVAKQQSVAVVTRPNQNCQALNPRRFNYSIFKVANTKAI